jgi:uncharacterized protein YccT (UPF0319 family)
VVARDTVQVERIDGREQPPVFIGQEHRYLVAPGEHAWIVRYSDIFYASDDTHDRVVSRPVRVTFTAEPGREYVFAHDPQKTLEAARDFASDPQLRVSDPASGGLIESTSEQGEDTGFFTSGQLPTDRDAFAAQTPGNGDPVRLPALKEAWRGASEAQRREFLEWVRSYSP